MSAILKEIMKEKFEHKLVNKIRDTFDSHEAEYNPQDWELLKDKLPEKRSALPLFWIMARASVVLLLVALGSYFLWDGLLDKESLLVKNETLVETTQEQREAIDKVPNQTFDSNNSVVQENLAEKIENKNFGNGGQQLIENKIQSQSDQVAEIVVSNEKHTSELMISQNNNIDSSKPSTKDSIVVIAENNIKNDDSLIQQDNQVVQTPIAQLDPSPDIYENKNATKEKVRLGAEFASFTNFSSEDITPDINYGGGVTVDIPIKRRFSFNPGLLVSVYNMKFEDNQNIVDPGADMLTTFSNLIEADPEVKPSEMNLTGLDIPINFQYQVIKRNASNYFVELGFSSLLYLSENYSYTFAILSDGPSPYGTNDIDNATTEDFSGSELKTFDFAKLINFSVGMDYRINKTLDITLNPYIKYPVSTLTSGDIKFGSGGLKLKLMIKPGK